MSDKNFYDILGVSKKATEKEIKKAYRELSKKHHPDVGGDENVFKEINNAYETLSDKKKRSEYDRFGSNSGNIRHRYQREPIKGENIVMGIKLTLEEIYLGVKKTFKYNRDVDCKSCDGHGGHGFNKCYKCDGSGIVIGVMETPFGSFHQPMNCDVCNGIGGTYDSKCNDCNGSGTKRVEESQEVDIPHGVAEGMSFILHNMGNFAKGGAYGDLYVKISELNHPIFNRNGNDLKMNLKFDYPQLVLGDKIELTTINGKIRINIPKGSEVNSDLRVVGKGMKEFKSNNVGDLIITLGIRIPKNIDEETTDLMLKLKEKFNE